MLLFRLLWAAAAYLAGREVVQFLFDQAQDARPLALPAAEPAAEDGRESEGGERDASELVALESREASEAADEEERVHETNRELALTAAGLAAVVLGSLTHPLIRFLSVPLIAVGFAPLTRQTWRTLRRKGKLKYPIVELTQGVSELFLGQLFLMAGGLLMFSSGRRALLATKRETEKTLVDSLSTTEESVWVLRGDAELSIPLNEVARGELVVIQTGDTVPVDGTIVKGVVGVDQRALTGEAELLELTVGDSVLAASLVLSGSAIVSTERTGRETVMTRVETLLSSMTSFEQTLTASIVRTCDRSVRPTLALAAFGLVTQGPLGAVAGLWTNTFGLAWTSSPISMLNTIQAAARGGILIKDGRTLEVISGIDTVVFDKTGTLTRDELEVFAVYSDVLDDRALMRFTAAVEQRQTHPIAQAIVRAVIHDPDPLPEVDGQMITIGYGVRARVEGRDVVVGSPRYFAAESISVPDAVAELRGAAERRGHSTIHVALDRRYAGTIEFAPQIRAEARRVIDELRARGIQVMILSGDDEAPTRVLAEALGIEEFTARALPEDKVEVLTRLQAAGRRVCFVGDGINDALAMRRANISISVSGGSALALESAQVILRGQGLQQLSQLFRLGDQVAIDQRMIRGAALVSTTINAAGLILARFSLSTVGVVYVAGVGVCFITALMPEIRRRVGWSLAPDAAGERQEPATPPPA